LNEEHQVAAAAVMLLQTSHAFQMSCATKQKLYLQILEKLYSSSSSSFVKVLFFTKSSNLLF
jgi:hypothetical protein